MSQRLRRRFSFSLPEHHPSLILAPTNPRVFGAGRLRAFRDITVPLIRKGALAAWVLLFVAALRELSSSVLLFTGPTRVISVEVYDMYSVGKLELAAAMGILLLALTLGVIAIVSRVVGKNYLGIRE